MTTRDKVLSGILGLLIVATIGATVYLNTSVPLGERFTEFYVLGDQVEVQPTILLS